MAINSINNVTVSPVSTMNYQSNNMTAMENKEVSVADSAPEVKHVNENKVFSDEQGSSSSLQAETQVSSEKLHKAVEELNKKMGSSSAVFGIHEETNRITIKLVDKQTREVIKELPPEKTLDMIARVWEMAGLMIDEFR